jgi:hypothetical protein
MKTTQTPYDVQFGLTVIAIIENRHLESPLTSLIISHALLINNRTCLQRVDLVCLILINEKQKGKEALWLDSPVFGEGDEAGKNKSQSGKEQEK